MITPTSLNFPINPKVGDYWYGPNYTVYWYDGKDWIAMANAYKETDELPITELTPVVETTIPSAWKEKDQKAVDDKIDAFNGTLNLFPEPGRLDEAGNEIMEIEFQGKKMWINMEDYKAQQQWALEREQKMWDFLKLETGLLSDKTVEEKIQLMSTVGIQLRKQSKTP